MRYARAWLVAGVVFVLIAPAPAAAYSVLTHEALIDREWNDHIQPLLQRKFRGLTKDALVRARSFAYGGSVIQDLGY